MLNLLRCILFLWWLTKILFLSTLIGCVVSVGMILINYFGTHQYGGDDFQMNLVTEMIGVWVSTCVTVLVVDRLYATRERDLEKRRLRHEIATGDNSIAKRAVNDLRYKELLSGKKGVLKHSYLTGALLQDADLHGANLNRVVLHSANLEGANLMNTDLQNSKLGMANLRKSKLFGAYIVGAELEGVDPAELNTIAKIARAKDLALGTNFQELLSLDTLLEKQSEQMLDLEIEYKSLIDEWASMISDASDLIKQAKMSSSPHGDVVEEYETKIELWQQQISETELLRVTNKEAMQRNAQDRKDIVNITLYGQEKLVADLDRAILPDGTLFTSDMTVSYLKKYTDPQHDEFDETLEKVNAIRDTMGYATRRRIY